MAMISINCGPKPVADDPDFDADSDLGGLRIPTSGPQNPT